MIASVMKRLHMIRAKLVHDPYLKHSLWRDVAHETFKCYGYRKAGIKNSMRVDHIDGFFKVGIEGRVIYWPDTADVARVVDMYFEVFNQGNNHYFDIPEMVVKTGDVVMDCGTCEGYFTRKALESGAGKVYCIEPGTAIVRCLYKTFESEIQGNRVSIHPCLIGDENKSVEFYDNFSDPTIGQISRKSEAGRHNGYIKNVQMVTVDEFCLTNTIDKVDFIKVDIEGGEVGLVVGAEKTIKRHRPNLAIAVYHAAENANLIVDFIEKLSVGYEIRVKGIVDFAGVPRPVMVHCYHAK
ncbi:FkbM family methyltransferase [Oryzomonas sagensis]|uniref:FkbM family methyltransferase n=1 Tax=Oryzomonas sagensis TaxID=2603857 RepID=A0ABQ6TPA2_9BACT|nr:FkbM family methyltransferase [Oryzomonas sagensis]KAB0670419.1 FkbM family methyltransferase [Oryzomonas sagensis]